jgi:tetratricopeptide (TPR) repeat protein
VFGLLGLAPGPDIGLPAAACLTGQPVSRCRALLRELENAHLLQQHAPGRYRMHDLVRQYAAEHAQQIHPLTARDAALARLTDFYLHTAHVGDRLLAPHRPPLPSLGPPEPDCAPLPLADESRAWTWFSSEHPCLLATQRLAADRGWHTRVWQLAWVLTTFHRRQGRLADQVAAWQAGLAATRSLGDPAAQILAQRYLAEACSLAGDHEGALLHHHRALSLAEDTGDVPGQALTHSALTGAWERRGDDRRALDHANRAMHLFRALGDRVQEARSLGDVGWYHARLGNYEPARAHCNAALTLHRQHHDREAEAAILDTLGYIAQHSGGHGQAADYYQQAAARFGELGDNYQEAEILERLAEVQETLGQRDQAHSTWKQALDLYLAHRRDADAERLQRRLAALGTAGRA